jgi:hypothetical protein
LLVAGLYSLAMYERLYSSVQYRLEVSPNEMVSCGGSLFGCFRPLELPQLGTGTIAEIVVGATLTVIGAMVAVKSALPYESEHSRPIDEPPTEGAPFK